MKMLESQPQHFQKLIVSSGIEETLSPFSSKPFYPFSLLSHRYSHRENPKTSREKGKSIAVIEQ